MPLSRWSILTKRLPCLCKGGEFCPELFWDSMLSQGNRLSNTLRAANTYNGRDDACITQGKLQSGSSQWDLIALTKRFSQSRSFHEKRISSSVHVTRVGRRPF